MLKSELRRLALVRRRSLPAAEAARLSGLLCAQLFGHFSFSPFRMVHCFLPIRKHNEVDTWQVVAALRQRFPEVAVAVPVSDAATHTLRHVRLTEQAAVQDNPWGVPEPLAGDAVAPQALDCVLLPLLAYDGRGFRVGYGKGFYDRFLAQCRPDVLKIGLAFEDPVPEITDIGPFDVPMHHCVTPHRVWTFGGAMNDAHP